MWDTMLLVFIAVCVFLVVAASLYWLGFQVDRLVTGWWHTRPGSPGWEAKARDRLGMDPDDPGKVTPY